MAKDQKHGTVASLRPGSGQASRPASAKASAGRPPVVAVLGHVDHGKTTLLDYIRKTTVAAREHGGITQHIGAYQIDYKTKSSEHRNITFIDTPGHEAFKKIRSRGAQAADIAILVVAANDSVKPQTIESIKQIQTAHIPMIVAINKIDLPDVIIDKVKSDLAKAGVHVEVFGGDVPFVLVSAKTGKGISDLLELILLVSDMKGLSSEPTGSVSAVVIEAKVDKFRGTVATLLIKSGTLTVGAPLYEGQKPLGKVRAMVDEHGSKVDAAPPGKPVEVLGFSLLPSIGAMVSNVPAPSAPSKSQAEHKTASAEDFLAAMTASEKKRLKLFLKADTSGSLEAVMEALPKKDIDVVRAGLGEVTEADVLEARATGAIIIGFNVKAFPAVEKLASHEKVIIRTYSIVYELLDEMEDVVENMEALLVRERELGIGKIIAEFPYDRDRIAGTKVTAGRLAKGDTVRVIRKEAEIGRARIKSLHQGKNEVTKVEVGGECGVLLDKKVDFTLQDDIIAFTTG